jgi:transposase InsO family protein
MEERVLVARIIELARRYGRYGYRRITALLQEDGWKVGHKRVERIWRREGLKVPAKQPRALVKCCGNSLPDLRSIRLLPWPVDALPGVAGSRL